MSMEKKNDIFEGHTDRLRRSTIPFMLSIFNSNKQTNKKELKETNMEHLVYYPSVTTISYSELFFQTGVYLNKPIFYLFQMVCVGLFYIICSRKTYL